MNFSKGLYLLPYKRIVVGTMEVWRQLQVKACSTRAILGRNGMLTYAQASGSRKSIFTNAYTGIIQSTKCSAIPRHPALNETQRQATNRPLSFFVLGKAAQIHTQRSSCHYSQLLHIRDKLLPRLHVKLNPFVTLSCKRGLQIQRRCSIQQPKLPFQNHEGILHVVVGQILYLGAAAERLNSPSLTWTPFAFCPMQ